MDTHDPPNNWNDRMNFSFCLHKKGSWNLIHTDFNIRQWSLGCAMCKKNIYMNESLENVDEQISFSNSCCLIAVLRADCETRMRLWWFNLIKAGTFWPDHFDRSSYIFNYTLTFKFVKYSTFIQIGKMVHNNGRKNRASPEGNT